MSNFHKTLLFILLVCFTSVAAMADAPRWVRKGVGSLNSQRSNTSYMFISLNTHDLDLKYLKESRTDALRDYVVDNFGAQYGSVKITLAQNSAMPVYYVNYLGQDGSEYRIEAKLVAEYDEFNDFELNVFQFEYYQLYAISRPNVVPDYDNFSLTQNYNGQAVVKSLIPGMGQLDKGQTTKGYVFMGGEVFFIGASLIFDWKRRDAKKMEEAGEFASSWHSKQQSWKNFEIGAIGCAAALYIYNLIDAATSKGATQVEVKKATRPYYSFTPYACSDELGVSLKVNF